MAKFSVLSFVLFALVGIHAVNGMDCNLGTSKNIVDQIIHTCPRPIIDSADESYCCYNPSKEDVTCCNFTDFVINSVSLLLPIIIVCLLVSFIVSCVCCLCCPCCCAYKRRSGGSCV